MPVAAGTFLVRVLVERSEANQCQSDIGQIPGPSIQIEKLRLFCPSLAYVVVNYRASYFCRIPLGSTAGHSPRNELLLYGSRAPQLAFSAAARRLRLGVVRWYVNLHGFTKRSFATTMLQ